MQVLLEEHDLTDFINKSLDTLTGDLPAETAETQTITLQKKDRRCKSLITQRIADSHLEYVKEKATAFEMWRALSESFELKGVASQLRLRKMLLTMRYATTETMASHFLKFDRLVRELKMTGANLDETDIVCHLLLTMPEEYNIVVTALETLSVEQLTLGFAKTRLLDEEAKSSSASASTKGTNSSTVFSAATRNRKPNVNNREDEVSGKQRARFKFKCHYCGMTGHKRSECRKLKQESKSPGSAKVALNDSQDNRKDFVFMAKEEEINSSMCWFLDSGSSEHLATKDVNLINVRKLTPPVNIRVAKSGQILTATEAGDLKVKVRVNEKIRKILISGVLSVSGLECNLLSVRKLEMNGFTITFKNGKGIIHKANMIAAIAYRTDKLYKLHFDCEMETVNLCEADENPLLWHRRLGHLSSTGLKKLQKQATGIKLKDVEISPEPCSICVEGKQTRLPHQTERIRAKCPLQLVHSDLCGPMDTTSYDGKRYLLTFIDDFTHFTIAYTLRTKSEVLRYFKMFQAMAEAHFNLKISRFRCDNGREYVSKEICQLFENCGIQYEFTIRYTPQQNGVAERMNRTIIEKARCMILNSKMSKVFWSEAVIAAVYLTNRSPTSALKDKLPAELWFGEKQDLRKLRVFGCVAYLHIPKELVNGKFGSRTKHCKMVGYCANGYRL